MRFCLKWNVLSSAAPEFLCHMFVCLHKFIALVSSCPLPFSAAGEFFPEAAQVAYQMWELSAVATTEVRTQLIFSSALCWLETTASYHCVLLTASFTFPSPGD